MIYHTHNDYCYEKWIKTQQNLDSFIRQNNLTGPMASSTNFQDDVRKWFTEISPDERAAALGFYADNTIVALLSSALSASSSTETTNNCLSSRTADKLGKLHARLEFFRKNLTYNVPVGCTVAGTVHTRYLVPGRAKRNLYYRWMNQTFHFEQFFFLQHRRRLPDILIFVLLIR